MVSLGRLAQPQFEPLQAGELVTTGTLTPPFPVRAGETWSVAFSGIELEGFSVQVG